MPRVYALRAPKVRNECAHICAMGPKELKEVSNSISCCYCGVRFKGGSLSLEAVSVGYGWRTSLLKSMCVQYRRTLYELCFLCYLESQVPNKKPTLCV